MYTPHWLLAFGGHPGHAEEGWSCGIRLVEDGAAPGESVDADDYLEAVAEGALTTWFMSPGAQIAPAAKLQWIKFNRIRADGHYEEQGVTHELLGLNVSGGAGGSAPLHQLQSCMVLSWHTAAASRGLASRGRIYSPRPAVPVDANGDVTAQFRLPAAEAAATLLNTLDIQVGLAGTLRPAIVSNGRPPYTEVGPWHQIDSVSVDSALDLQHRRARQQSRESSTAPVSY